MKIKTRLYISAGLVTILTIIIVSVVYVTSNKIADENEERKLVNGIYTAVSELNIITHEYLMHHEERMKVQWNSKYYSAGKIIGKFREKQEEQEKVGFLKLIRENYATFGELFSRVTKNYEKKQKLIQEGASQEKIDDTNLREERLVAQFLIISQSIFGVASRLAEKARIEAIKVQKLVDTLILISMIVLAIIATTTTLLVARSISKPINKLIKGTEIIGEGNLEHKIDIKSEDEIGELAIAFDKMTASIKVVTASRDELNQEITERKKAEEELEKHTLKLEAANKDLESFSYSVSHDLRAPLRAIDGFSQIIIEDHSKALDKEGLRLLNVIRDNTKNMGQLIDDLLAFSRLSRKKFKTSKLVMGKLVQDTRDELMRKVSGRRIKWIINELAPARGDNAVIRQVWLNLLSNAIKFTRLQKNAVIEVGCECDGKETIYYVKDNGVGFDTQYVGKLFNVFQRLHSGEEFEGTGVGLAIIKRIIHKHGGRVWADGKVNEGASFYFTLPTIRR